MHAVALDQGLSQAIWVFVQLLERAPLGADKPVAKDIVAIAANSGHDIIANCDFEPASRLAQRAGAVNDPFASLNISHPTTVPQMAEQICIAFSICRVKRILPEPAASTTVADAYGVSRQRHPDGRPWIGMCMVMSIDGSTVVNGNSQALSSPADLSVLVGLRKISDVIIVGAATVRLEGYGPPSKPGLAVGVVTRATNLSEDVDLTSKLFTSGSGFLIMPQDANLDDDATAKIASAEITTVRSGRGSVDLAAAMRQIDGTFAQLEGGAALNAAMFAADLVDEINITISPRIVGGDGPRLSSRAPEMLLRYEIAHVLEDDGFLFVRYLRKKN
jgi:riboflavin biosynthesis pyrimidine reductase